MTVAGEIDLAAPVGSVWPRRVEWLACFWLEGQRGLFVYWLPVFFGTGIAGYFGLRFEPPWEAGAGLLALMLAVTARLFPVRQRSVLHGFALYGCGAILVAVLGFCMAQFRTHHLASPMLTRELKAVDVTGRVRGIEPLQDDEGMRLILGDLSVERLSPEETPRFIRIKVRDAEGIELGQKVKMLAGLAPPSSPVAPNAFDFQFYAWFRQIGAFGFAYDQPRVIEEANPWWFDDLAQRMRRAINARINAAVGGGPRAAMAIAFTTGEVSAVSKDDWNAMRMSGLAHMLAISGSHVALVAGFVFFAVRALLALFPYIALYWPVKKIAAGVALAVVTLFVYIVGPLIPVLRALVMTDIVLIGVMFDRVSISMRLLAFAGLALMAWMPEVMLGPSFQMSYAAVAALVLFYEATKEWWRRVYSEAGPVRKAGIYILGVCVTSLAAELATASFAIYNFQQFSVYGLLANMLAEPFMSFIVMPSVILVFMALPFHLEGLALKFMGWGVDAILAIAYRIAAWPHAVLHVPAWPPEALGFMVLAAACALLMRGRVRVVSLPLLVCGVAAVVLYHQPDILVSPSGKLIAVRTESGSLSLSNLVAEKFTAQGWMRMAGHEGEDPDKWPREGLSGDGLGCDEDGCRLVRNGRKVAFPRSEMAQAEDCAWADIVVSRFALHVEPCAAPVKIDAYTLREEGAQAIWLNGLVESVGQTRGNRPWAFSNVK